MEMLDPLKELDKIPKSEWPRMWADLNKHQIPVELQHTKPEWWETEIEHNGHHGKCHTFIWPIMGRICRTVGNKACNREWNRETMTDEEHEAFWKTNFF